MFGSTAIEQQFHEFSDSVSTQYGVPGLCALTYSVSPTADALDFGVSILISESIYYINVLTTDPSRIGQIANLTL